MLFATIAILAQLAAPGLGQPDDDEVLREARSAQARFERMRRSSLPIKQYAARAHCDERIGRFCYWYDSTERAAEPEPARVTRARDSLIANLKEAQQRLPHEPWIVGQLVRYLIEGGRADQALDATVECRAERWWCSALAGLALHESERYAAADSAFAVSLSAMPEGRRCQWLGIEWTADVRWLAALKAANCVQRAAIAQNVWTLGQPLWMTGGNDLRTEHFSRWTMGLILEDAASANAMRFGEDSRELLIRYGWPTWYTRHVPGITAYAGDFDMVGHDREPSYHFLPRLPLPSDTRLNEASFDLRDSVARTRYAPRHIERLTSLRHQLARFPAGDSMLVMVRYAQDDTAMHGSRTSVEMLALEPREGPRRIARGNEGTIVAMIPRRTTTISIEAYDRESKHAARARYTIDGLDCAATCLPDILVVDPAGADSVMLPVEALRRAYASDTIQPGQALGIYWQLDGVAPGDPVSYSLTLTPIRVSRVRRIAASLRLASRPEAVRMRWSERVREAGGSLLALSVPTGVRGRYRLVLTARTGDGTVVTTEREVELAR